MVRVAVVGLGKMGASHLAIVNAHPDVTVVGVCDSTGYILDVMHRNTGLPVYSDYTRMLEEAAPDAVIIATPSRSHGPMVERALAKGLHVFCEKPFCLDPEESERLAALSDERALVNQVGYHYRFVGAFQEMRRLLDAGAIGRVSHVLAEAYGPVVLRPKGSTWRTQRTEGGGCLYDYAAHPLNLLTWFFGAPQRVEGCVLGRVFSRDTDDEVYASLFYDAGPSVQLSVNWSDESCRKMSTRITAWGENGRIAADRQECRVWLRDADAAGPGYGPGWNIRYTTELTQPVWFYLRGEEYSAQIDYFVKAVLQRTAANVNSFTAAAQTDRVIGMIAAAADGSAQGATAPPAVAAKTRPRRGGFRF